MMESTTKDEHPLIEQYDEFYTESEDEEINLSLLEVEQEGKRS